MVVPLAHAGQPAHGLIILTGERRHTYTLQDFLTCVEVSQAAAYHVKALQQAWYSNGERILYQHLESLTQDLGNKLSFDEMFEVVARWVPRLVPAVWVGVTRLAPDVPDIGMPERQRTSLEVWIDRGGGMQPPLISSVEPLLNAIDPALPLTYITPDQSNGLTDHPLVVIPVRLGHQTIAALAVASATAAGFSERNLATLRELSASVALAFRYVQLFEMVERAKRDWEHSFDAITDTLAVISPQRSVRRVNKGFLQERGMRPGEAVNRPCDEALYGLAEPCQGCPLDNVVALGAASEVEVRSAVDNGVYLVSLFPIQNEDGEVVDLVEFAKDVTLSRDLQDKLLQTEHLRALGKMASGTAHEFNNTLAGVLGQVELLLATAPDAHMERGLHLIAQAAADGAATVRRIQNFSKTSRGEDVVPADLSQIVLDAVGVCAPPLERPERTRRDLGADSQGAAGIIVGSRRTIGAAGSAGQYLAECQGKGTKATIRLPKARNLPAKPTPVIEPGPSRALRILVADDDARLADMLQHMLALDGHKVTVCHGGAAALEQVATAPYDVVLTDLGMPEVSGWDILAAARELQPGICTGLVTGWGVMLEDVELVSKGVDAVIPKPYTMTALRATVARLSELGRR
ncbi:MAG: response regulator [Dehalococcoidia bacterium]|nr:response regulator [Dehalococcoidia bacterium]